MSYTVVTMETELKALEDQVKDAKQKNTYTNQQQHFDAEVQKVMTKWCPIAEHSVKTNFDLTTTVHEQAKQAVDLAEKTLKKKDLNNDDLKLIEHLPVTIQQYITRLSGDGADLMTGNLQYRGGWPAIAKQASPQSTPIVDQWVGKRAKLIDQQPTIVALKKRVEEYLPRAQEFVKQAKQRMSQGGVAPEEFWEDVKDIKQKMEAGKTAIESLRQKKSNQIQTLKNMDKTKTWSPVEAKTAKSILVDIMASAKSARGQLKTLDVLYEGLEKRGKAAGPGWKEMAAKAVSEASKPYKAAADESKALDSDETKCVKICKDHKVTV
jgi:hypothetical protein